jgi:hypothetical protein
MGSLPIYVRRQQRFPKYSGCRTPDYTLFLQNDSHVLLTLAIHVVKIISNALRSPLIS